MSGRVPSSWQMLHVDCFDHMASMADKSVDLCLLDPPYEPTMHAAKARAGGKRKLRTDGANELKALDFADVSAIRDRAARELVRIASGWVLIFCTPEGIEPWRTALEAAGARYKRACFWVKPDSAPQMNGQGPAFAVEPFVAVWCGSGFSRWNGGGRRNWWICPTNGPWRDGRHPTEKPSALMADLVNLFSAPDALVFDPFAGSGSTGVGAIQMNRRFVGCENNADWHAVATERLLAASALHHATPRFDFGSAAHG